MEHYYRYENIVQIRCLLEGIPAEEILRDWHNLLPRQMSTWGLERGEVRRNACITLFNNCSLSLGIDALLLCYLT
jgi:hypothetical protein